MDLEAIRADYEKRYPQLRELSERLEANVKGLLRGVPHIDRIYFRAKEPRKFVQKCAKGAGSAYEHPLSEIEDQVAGRVLVFFLDDIEAAVSLLRRHFTTVESVRKTPEKHDAFGYESFHCVFTIPPQVKPADWHLVSDPPVTFEMQVRTLFQHAWAEPQHGLGYKGDPATPREALRELAWAAASAWGADHAIQRALTIIRGGKSDA